MHINSVSKVSFSSVMPVNVYNNNSRVYDETFVRMACRKATKLLAGPISPEYYDFASQLEALDDSYTLREAAQGLCKKWRDFETGEIIKEVPSDYFKILFDRKGNPFIVSGKDSVNLAVIGKALGIEKKKCRDAGVKDSRDLNELKKYYNWFANSLVENKAKRLKEDMHLGISMKTGTKNKKPYLDEVFLIQG